MLFGVQLSSLQSLRGSSGSHVHYVQLAGIFPSIPQGFVWKPQLRLVRDGLLPPSIPQGFVWKARNVTSSSDVLALQSLRGSSGRHTGVAEDERPPLPSIPQGFVWKTSFLAIRRTASSLQSLRGSSGSHSRDSGERRRSSFNPSGVRLEAGEGRKNLPKPVLQSLRGSSGRPMIASPGAMSTSLQSLRGSSGSDCRRRTHAAPGSFNPSGVRLEGPTLIGQASGPGPFNPSGVRLEGRLTARRSGCARTFNPSGVRLEGRSCPSSLVPQGPSIPQGFVWKPATTASWTRSYPSFNPSGVRLEGSSSWSSTPLIAILQSLRGSSGRPAGISSMSGPKPLQSLRGSSGRRRR